MMQSKLPRLPAQTDFFTPKYTAEQMREYARKAIEAELKARNIGHTHKPNPRKGE
jgi:Tfp pilus assembly protein PilP